MERKLNFWRRKEILEKETAILQQIAISIDLFSTEYTMYDI